MNENQLKLIYIWQISIGKMFKIISQYEKEMKTIKRYHYIPLRMAKMKDTEEQMSDTEY